MKEPFVEPRIAPESTETTIQSGLRDIVQHIYGRGTPQLPGLDIGRSYLGTAHDFIYGGDLVDVFHHASGSTSLAVVDITGHGIHAAMYAGLVKHALRAYFSQGCTALQVVQAINHLCIENSAFEGEENLFATLFFGVIDSDRRAISYVSAGHDTAYVIGSLKVTALGACGPIIGLLDDKREFSSKRITISTGDTLAIVTDGFTEARNEEGIFLGSRALADIILAHPQRNAQMSAEAIVRRAYDYTQHNNHDDVAALVVKIMSTEPARMSNNGTVIPLR